MSSTVFSMSEPPRKANWKDLILYRLGRRRVFLVKGDSMTPTISSGEAVLVRPAEKYSIGDIVLADHPYKKSVRILKRVARIEHDGALHLVGDNPAKSTDSRTFGAVSIESIIGRVVCRLK